MKISVITPSFNQGQFLEECILSVLNQGYSDLEYIIIDGGSSDSSVQIIEKYADKLAYWISERDNGQSEAINKGFLKATGEVVTWLCSDDAFVPGTLKKIYNEFKTSENVKLGLIYGGTRLFNAEGFEKYDYGFRNNSLERYISGMAFPQPSSFFKLKYLKHVGYLDESLHYGMDYDLFMRLALVCDFKFVNEIFSNYRLQNNSKSSLNQCDFIKDWITSYRSLLISHKKDTLLNILVQLKIGDDKSDLLRSFPNEHKIIDWRLSSYYFLTYVFKSDYICGNFKRARTIGLYMMKHYFVNLIRDKELLKIAMRLMLLPDKTIIKMRLRKKKV